jgi:uncharacterized membrane protein YkvA (DUF1232 family)
MSLQINFELSDTDLDHFCKVLKHYRDSCQPVPAEQIIENTKQLLKQINHSDAKDFILERIRQLEILIKMLEDQNWHLANDDRERVLTALSYFSQSADLIPDDIPGLGFLDDAIMIEIVCQELKHEIQAYRDFKNDCASRARQEANSSAAVKDNAWIEERRAQLHARMRRRRKNQPPDNKSKSPFSLF